MTFSSHSAWTDRTELWMRATGIWNGKCDAYRPDAGDKITGTSNKRVFLFTAEPWWWKWRPTFDVLSGSGRGALEVAVTPWEVAAALALTIDDFQHDTAVLANWRYIAPTVLYIPQPPHARWARQVRNKIGLYPSGNSATQRPDSSTDLMMQQQISAVASSCQWRDAFSAPTVLWDSESTVEFVGKVCSLWRVFCSIACRPRPTGIRSF